MYRMINVGQFYKVQMVKGFQTATDLIRAGRSYLYVQNLEGIELISEQNFHRPSQYFRTMVASRIGYSGWDWRENPDYETLERTVDRLKNKI